MYDINHLQSNNYTYFQHFTRAIFLAFLFYIGFLLTLIHAFFPWILPTVSSDLNTKIYKTLHKK